ncbi:hypothetical protein N2152v2_001531 [Parachlorella kessleri]
MLATDTSEELHDAAVEPSPSAEGCSPEDEPAMFKSDSFRMNCMKVLQCSKRYVHDWTECPFAHPQEKARRRDPRVHTYTGIACPSMKKEGTCAFGDHCPYAHNVFEYWLHPTRYRTQLCNDGSNCKRKICFFAHSLDELRVPACKPFVSPEALAAAAAAAAADEAAKRKTGGAPPLLGGLGDVLAAQQFDGVVDALRSPSSTTGAAGTDPSQVAVPPSPMGPVATAGGRRSSVEQLSATLQALQGRCFSQQEQQVIELVTNMLSQDKISAAQAASILQAMLPATALQLLQSQLLAPATPTVASGDAGFGVTRANSDPLNEAVTRGRASFDEVAAAAGVRLSVPAAPAAANSMYATMMALQGGAAGGGGYTTSVPAAGGMSGYPGQSPRASLEYPNRGVSFDASSMRSSFDATGLRDSMDYGSVRGPNSSLDYTSGRGAASSMDYGSVRGPSIDYSHQGSLQGSLDLGIQGMQMAQASNFYQQQSQRNSSASLAALLPPVPEHGLPPASQPLPPASEALAQLAARVSIDATQAAAAPALRGPSTPAPGAAAAAAAAAAAVQQQAARRHSTDYVGAQAGAAAAPAAPAAGPPGLPPRRHSVDTAALLQQQREQQQLQRSRQSVDAPYLSPVQEGLIYTHPGSAYLQPQQQQYLAVPPMAMYQQQMQYEDARASLDANAEMLHRLSSEFGRVSLDEPRTSMDRRAPVVVNPYSSSFFAPAAGAPVPGGTALVAPTPTRAVQVPEPPYPQGSRSGLGGMPGAGTQ